MLRSILLKFSDRKASRTGSLPTPRLGAFLTALSLAKPWMKPLWPPASAMMRNGGHSGLSGENVATPADAQKARDTYLKIYDRIAQEKLNANVSCKLTQLGLDLSVEFCEGLVLSIAERPLPTKVSCASTWKAPCTPSAPWNSSSVFARKLPPSARYPGLSLPQRKRHHDLLSYGCRIRLCKGAYKESIEVAYPRKADVDGNYTRLMRLLLSSGFYHAIATHDPRMVAATIRWAAEKKISKDDFEFQMLYGVRADLQRQLVRDGYRVRIYVPLRHRMVPVLHAPPRGAPRQIGFFLQYLPLLIPIIKTVYSESVGAAPLLLRSQESFLSFNLPQPSPRLHGVNLQPSNILRFARNLPASPSTSETSRSASESRASRQASRDSKGRFARPHRVTHPQSGRHASSACKFRDQFHVPKTAYPPRDKYVTPPGKIHDETRRLSPIKSLPSSSMELEWNAWVIVISNLPPAACRPCSPASIAHPVLCHRDKGTFQSSPQSWV